MKVIEISWEGPFLVGYDRESDTYVPPDFPPGLEESSGVYQIYGNHPVYGPDSLLYIGQSRKSNTGRSILNRIKEHLAQRFLRHVGLSIYLGEVRQNNELLTDQKIIDAVESLLIASNMPVLNRQNIDSAKDSARDLLVINWGFRGAIVPEASGILYCE